MMHFILMRLFVTASLMPWMTHARSHHLETNDIDDIFNPNAEEKPLPECVGNTICAYLQVNAKGINTQSLCSCQGPTRCPLIWDNEDGHSVTQGSDQYKYCQKAPKLRTCQRGMTAYSSLSLMSKSTGELISLKDTNHCICPPNANYDLVGTKFDDIDDDVESMTATYVCSQLKNCGVGEACKVITETPNTFLVNPKCRCAPESACPSSAVRGKYLQTPKEVVDQTSVGHHQQHRFVETTRYGTGALHMIYCH